MAFAMTVPIMSPKFPEGTLATIPLPSGCDPGIGEERIDRLWQKPSETDRVGRRKAVGIAEDAFGERPVPDEMLREGLAHVEVAVHFEGVDVLAKGRHLPSLADRLWNLSEKRQYCPRFPGRHRASATAPPVSPLVATSTTRRRPRRVKEVVEHAAKETGRVVLERIGRTLREPHNVGVFVDPLDLGRDRVRRYTRRRGASRGPYPGISEAR